MKFRKLHALVLVPLAVLVLLLGREFAWRAGHDLLKPQAPAPDGRLVAEVRALPGPAAADGPRTGVFVRGRTAWLRSVQPRLVFAGACDEVSARWFGQQRLVIECELRAGEPRLLQDFVDGVVIELVVQRRFA